MILALRRLPRSWSQTAFCMVKLEATRMAVKIPARMVSRWAPAGGQTEAWARMVKNAANSELKNITSEPSQMITPTASIDGLSGTVALAATGPPDRRRGPGSRRIFSRSEARRANSSAREIFRCRSRGPGRGRRVPAITAAEQGGRRAVARYTTVSRWVGRVRATYSGAQAPGRLPGDDGRLDHDHRVELEAVGRVGGQQHERLGQPALRMSRASAAGRPAASSATARSASSDAGARMATRPGADGGHLFAGQRGHLPGQVARRWRPARARSAPDRECGAPPRCGAPGGAGVSSGAATASTRAGHRHHLGRRPVAHRQLDRAGRAAPGQVGGDLVPGPRAPTARWPGRCRPPR